MPNGLNIYMDGEYFVTLLVHDLECEPLTSIMDKYAAWGELDRSKMTCKWARVVDITSEYPNRLPVAKGDWP